MFRVFADNSNCTSSFNNLALIAHFLNAWSNFHQTLLKILPLNHKLHQDFHLKVGFSESKNQQSQKEW
jgi:hypothetical protein